jgi:uncharacterized protein (TIGR03435 family)
MLQARGRLLNCAESQLPAFGWVKIGLVIGMLLAWTALPVPRLCAQERDGGVDAPNLPSFEVASIKPAKPGSWHSDLDETGDRLTIQNYTVRHLIREAYGLKSDSQVLGGPDWIDKQAFDIAAKIDDAEVARMHGMSDNQSGKEWGLMLQSLLADRFGLRASRDERVLPTFALVVTKSGAKIRHSTAQGAGSSSDDQGIEVWGGEMTANAVSMNDLADSLTGLRDIGNRVVVNRTGLDGDYDFKLTWARDRGDGASTNSPYPELFTALPEQLGLKLKPERSRVDVVVIESASEPTIN